MRTTTRVAGALALAAALMTVPAAAGDESWRREFEEICAKTQDAMVLPVEELRSLVERCDKLAPVLDGLGEAERKVFGRRLRACRDLYAYVLESRLAAP